MPVGNVVPSKGVIRCLFGPVDHEQRKKELNRLSNVLDQRSCERWNFDFSLGTPMSGKYTWEQVVINEHVPKAYELSNLETFRRFSRVSLSPKSDEIQKTVVVPAGSNSSLVKTSELSNDALKMSRPSTPVNRKRRRETNEQLSQRLITDYYKSVKSDVAKRRKIMQL